MWGRGVHTRLCKQSWQCGAPGVSEQLSGLRVQAPTPLNLWVLTDSMGCSLPWRWGMSEAGHLRRRRPEWGLGECHNGTSQRKQPGFPRVCQIPHRQVWAPCLELLSEDTIVQGNQTAPHHGPGAHLPVCQGTPLSV